MDENTRLLVRDELVSLVQSILDALEELANSDEDITLDDIENILEAAVNIAIAELYSQPYTLQ